MLAIHSSRCLSFFMMYFSIDMSNAVNYSISRPLRHFQFTSILCASLWCAYVGLFVYITILFSCKSLQTWLTYYIKIASLTFVYDRPNNTILNTYIDIDILYQSHQSLDFTWLVHRLPMAN